MAAKRIAENGGLQRAIYVDPDHWHIFIMLHRNCSKRIRELVLLDLRSAKRKGRLDGLLAAHPDDEELARAIAAIPE